VVDDESAGSFERLSGTARVRCVSLPLERALESAPAVDLVVHLAAKVGVGPVVRDPESCRAHNVASTRALLDALARMSAASRPRLFAASSSEVYLPASRPLREDDPLRPADAGGRWAYAAAKVECEQMIDAAGLWEHERAPVHLRFFNVVGPGQDSAHGMMLPTFVEHALAHRPIPVHGEGRSVRTLAHVDDVALTLCALAQHPALPGGPLNVGGTARATVLEVAQCVLAQSRSRGGIAHVDPRRVVGPAFEDVDWREPDLARLEGLGVPVPARTLESIVADTLARHAAQKVGRIACASRAS
jgi:UDP-glucose 4-epimerase